MYLITGALSDQAGDYDGAFYLAGISIALSGVICFPLRAICRWEKRREEHKKGNHGNGNAFNSNNEITSAVST